MAKTFSHLRFNWHGLQFENAIKGLLSGYSATLAGLEDQTNRAAMEVDDYDTRRQQDQLEPYEVDEIEETGRVLLPYRDILLLRVDDLERQAHDLRIAYSLMLYHQWERSARSWTKKGHGKFEGLIEAVKALGLTIDPQLEELRILVNVIKHDSDRWGKELATKRPDLIDDEPYTADGSNNWFICISLSHQALLQFFDVVKRSGPNVSSDNWDDAPFW